MKKKCILVSFFNSNNIGDLAISSFVFNDLTSLGLDVKKCSVECDFNIYGTYRTNYLSRAFRKLRRLVFQRYRLKKFEAEIKNRDFVIFAGGNMFMALDEELSSMQCLSEMIDLAKANSKNVLVWSIGIGPFLNNDLKKYAIDILTKCDFVSFRDEESYLIADGYRFEKFNISVDPVLLLDKKISRICESEKEVGVGVINPMLLGVGSEKYCSVLNGYINVVNKFLDLGYNVNIFSTEIADYKMAYDIKKQFDGVASVTVIMITDFDQLISLYSRIGFLVSARMHSLIIAYTQGVPIFGLSWQEKVVSFFKKINSIDRQINLFSIDDDFDKIFSCFNSNANSSINNDFDQQKEKFMESYKLNHEALENIISS